MKYKRFEDLPVWQTAIEMGVKVYRLTEDRFFHQPGDLQDQLRRSSLSVSQNIAEGFERGSDSVFANSLAIAKGSSGELRTQLYIAARLDYVASEKMKVLVKQAEEISRMLSGLIKRLKSS